LVIRRRKYIHIRGTADDIRSHCSKGEVITAKKWFIKNTYYYFLKIYKVQLLLAVKSNASKSSAMMVVATPVEA